jgi:parallel beta-helix repeat protein
MSEADIASDFATVQDNDQLAFAPGTYEFNNQLALGTANGVIVIGSGMGQTILDFHGQQAAEDGLFAQSVNDLTIEDLTIEETPGNGIKTLGVTGMTFRSLEVKWAALDHTDGPYGLYPVQCKNVMIESCKISGASDSGIYIGQSDHIVVQKNEAFNNVAGIEIENSFNADVHDNNSHDNTGGILVFDLPNLQQEGGHNVRVYNNQIVHNDTRNFAPSGDIVGLVPAGTGFFVMANHDVEVFGNTITDNQTVGAGIISYKISMMTFTDPKYYEYPKRVYLHDNTYSGNGTLPDARNQVGLLLGTLGMKQVPDVLYDGEVDPAAGSGMNTMQICVKEPKADGVCDLEFPKLNANYTNLKMVIDCAAPYLACTLPPLPAVTWTGMPQ